MTIVQKVDVVAMPDGGVAAVRTVLMVVMGVMRFVTGAHTAVSLVEVGRQRAGRKHLLANGRRDSGFAAGQPWFCRVRPFFHSVGHLLRKAYREGGTMAPTALAPATCGTAQLRADGQVMEKGIIPRVHLCVVHARLPFGESQAARLVGQHDCRGPAAGQMDSGIAKGG